MLDIDTVVKPSDITIEQAEDLSRLEPYGISNPTPVFAVRGAVISDISPLSGKHTKFTLRMGDSTFTALWFSKNRNSIDLYVKDTVDMAFQMSVNEFRGRKSVQLIVKDMVLSNPAEEISAFERAEFKRVMGGGTHKREDGYMPGRDDFAKVYLYLKRRGDYSRDERTGVREIVRALENKLSYVKVKLILEILEESGLISIERSPECEDNLKITVNFVRGKADLEGSPTCMRIRSRMEKPSGV